jgi:hypothetical protein
MVEINLKSGGMNKIQKLNFKTIGEFLDYLPENDLLLVNYLREIVLDSIPDCQEKLSYNVPFYVRNSRICYIWPPSIPWGNTIINGVQLGFCYGNLLNDEIEYLEKGTRKQVYRKEFTDIGEIDIYLLKSYLYDAVLIDEQHRRRPKNKYKTKNLNNLNPF